MSMDIKQLALTGRGNPSSIRTMSQFSSSGGFRAYLVDVHQVVRDLAGTVLSISTLVIVVPLSMT